MKGPELFLALSTFLIMLAAGEIFLRLFFFCDYASKLEGELNAITIGWPIRVISIVFTST